MNEYRLWVDNSTTKTVLYAAESYEEACRLAKSDGYKLSDKQEKDRLEERLHEILTARFGTDWRHELSLNMRADNLSWILKMACWGVESLIAKTDQQDFMAKLNVAELHRMLSEFIESIATTPVSIPKKKKKS